MHFIWQFQKFSEPLHQIKQEDNKNNNNHFSPSASRLSDERMKKEDIKTLDDLKVFLTAYQEENPEDDCCELVRGICQENGWIYTADSSLGYDDEDFATDGEHILSLTSNGFEVLPNDGQDFNYNGTDITVREDSENFFVDFNTGLGEGIYPKADWTLEKAIRDQENIYKENK